MDFDRIASEVVAEMLNPLRERRDYGGNQLDKCECGKCEKCRREQE